MARQITRYPVSAPDLAGGGAFRNFRPCDLTGPKRPCRAFKIWPSPVTDMVLLPRLATLLEMPVIFPINNREASMSKNQSCRFLEGSLRDTGHYKFFR